MAELTILEGTWEEIKLHEEELSGKWLRITILSDKTPHKTEAKAEPAPRTVKPRLSARGKYAGLLSTEDYFRMKQEEIELEERKFQR